MEIKVYLNKTTALSICIGHDTAWFQQIDFITITKEFYEEDNCNVEFAKLLFRI